MSAPEFVQTDSTSSLSLESDEIMASDLPTGVVETARSDVAIIIDTEVGRLGAPGLISEGTGLGEINPSSDLDSDKNSLPPMENVPTFQSDADRALLDGESQDSAAISEFRSLRSRGKLNKVTTAHFPTEQEKKKQEEKEKKLKEKQRKEQEKREAKELQKAKDANSSPKKK